MDQKDVGGVAIVMPMFSPRRESIDRLQGLAAQARQVILVDDNPAENRDWSDALGTAPNVRVIRHATNRGIAAALNTGVREVLDAPEIEYVITLDQDSELPTHYVEKFLCEQAANDLSNQTTGILCPERMDGRRVATRRNGAAPYDPMQSGMFIPLSTFRKVGLFDESLFIDAVDSDFALRTRKSGLDVEFVRDTDLQHGLGEQIPATIFGRNLRWRGATKFFSSHSATRLYYIARNHLIVNVRFLGFDPAWVMRRFYEDIKLVGINIVFGPEKPKLGLAVSAGLLHGAMRKAGKIPPRLSRRLAAKRPADPPRSG
ncbi:glycosyltransferase [Sinomonas albida]|uniref:glycosyltransferase n=1 Tax=Sinomonas albida TaxID=369942 RepID=UPI00301986CA